MVTALRATAQRFSSTTEYTAICPAGYLVPQLFRKKTQSSIISTPHAVFYEVNSLHHILLLALYIPISARSISGTVRDYFLDEGTFAPPRKLRDTVG
jgi:hypothetical protein